MLNERWVQATDANAGHMTWINMAQVAAIVWLPNDRQTCLYTTGNTMLAVCTEPPKHFLE